MRGKSEVGSVAKIQTPRESRNPTPFHHIRLLCGLFYNSYASLADYNRDGDDSEMNRLTPEICGIVRMTPE